MRTNTTTAFRRPAGPSPTSRRVLAGAAALALGLTLTACTASATPDAVAPTAEAAGGPAAGAGASGEAIDPAHADADVAFAAGMIPHHQQAVEMSEAAVEISDDPDLVALAEGIEAAQEPEIETMTRMLETWGEPTPSGSDGGMMMGSDGMDADGMVGMMSDADMADLDGARGSDFDRMWLTMMIEHHEGAVEMSRTELADGENPQAKELAQAIIDAQEAEITTMQGMLDG